jgi:hypothetical protein
MAKAKKPQFGELPPQYSFVLNPYPDMRVGRCPYCERKTGQRKLPLLIHVRPMHLIALNYTCRYCHACDLLIADKHAIEHLLTEMFSQYDPEAVGNEYLIIGTVEKTAWREGLQQPKAVAEMLPHASDFAEYYRELRVTRPGWYPAGQEPPVMEPPPSQEWVKSKPETHVPQVRPTTQ